MAGARHALDAAAFHGHGTRLSVVQDHVLYPGSIRFTEGRGEEGREEEGGPIWRGWGWGCSPR